MLNVRLNSPRLDTRFHSSEVTQLLPEYFSEAYPNLDKFLKLYYSVAGEDNEESFEHQIKSLFNMRDISSTTIESLDLILGEVGNGLQHTAFAQNPRLMVKLISDFYRAKGSQISAEQFFKSFFAEDVDISYPKRDMFILNQSKIGAESLKYITDGRKYQVFSILIKTGLSFSDYEALYRKFVHPAGFYLSAEVVLQSQASVDVGAGATTDPLEVPSYPIVMGASVPSGLTFSPTLMTLRETDSADSEFILNSTSLMSTYENESFQSLLADGFDTIASLAALNDPDTIDGSGSSGSPIQTLDTDDHI